METIQQHEWEPYKSFVKCKHCTIRLGVFKNSRRVLYWDGSPEGYFVQEPACITRHPEQDVKNEQV